MLIVNSGVRHELASGAYAARRKACERAAAAMGIGSLRDADEAGLARAAVSDEQRRCARHVLRENARTLAAAAAFRDAAAGRCAWAAASRRVGELMVQSHASLRDDFAVSCEELDALVEIACGLPGVYGARMTGAGFGGCVVALADPSAVAAASQAIRTRYRERCGRVCDPFGVTAANGAGPIEMVAAGGHAGTV